MRGAMCVPLVALLCSLGTGIRIASSPTDDESTERDSDPDTTLRLNREKGDTKSRTWTQSRIGVWRKNFQECMAKKAELVAHLRTLGFPIPDEAFQHGHVAGGRNIDNVGGGVTAPELENLMLKVAMEDPAATCQTGFNYGISALAQLCASTDNTQVYSWDLGQYQYVKPAHDWISKEFNGRHKLTLGDSTETLKDAIAQKTMGKLRCGFVFVDGGHTQTIAHADIVNFKSLAMKGAMLVVDDCPRGKYTQGVFRAVVDAKEEGLIGNYTQEDMDLGSSTFRRICTAHYL